MNKKLELIIKNGTVFYQNKFQKVNILINKGKIIEINKKLKSNKAKKIINAKNKTIIPRIIEIHFNVDRKLHGPDQIASLEPH